MVCKIIACMTCEKFWVKIRNKGDWKKNANFKKCKECKNHKLWEECQEWKKL